MVGLFCVGTKNELPESRQRPVFQSVLVGFTATIHTRLNKQVRYLNRSERHSLYVDNRVIQVRVLIICHESGFVGSSKLVTSPYAQTCKSVGLLTVKWTMTKTF